MNFLRLNVRLLWVVLAITLGLSSERVLADSHTLGILAFRPAPVTEAQWQPLVDYLNEQVDGLNLRLRALDYPDLEAAVAAGEIDFILTNPAHFVLLSHRQHFSAPLASLVRWIDEQPVHGFGGVIVTTANHPSIQDLTDLYGQMVATVSKGSLGGYQMQAYELQRRGIDPSKRLHWVITGMPHDAAIHALLQGEADAAFVRSGIIEAMLESGELSEDDLRILNAQPSSNFPYRLSTPLYPEWPFAAMAHTETTLASQVAAAILTLPWGGELAQSMEIYGFTIPADYRPVETLLRELRIPPFDAPPEFTLYDIWQRWQWQFTLLLISGGFGLLIVVALMRARQQAAQQQAFRVKLLSSLAEGVYGVDTQGRCTFINTVALDWLGYRKDEVLGQDQHALFHHAHPDGSPYPHSACPIYQTLRDGQERRGEEWFWRKDGSGFPVEFVVTPLHERGRISGGLLAFQDISARSEKEAEQKKYTETIESFFALNLDLLMISDFQGHFIKINEAWAQILGYSTESLCDKTFFEFIHPDDIQPTLDAVSCLGTGQDVLDFINRYRRQDGTYRYLEWHAHPKGEYIYAVARDVTERMQIEHDLVEAKQAAEAANIAKSRFLATMSHEIRTPMNGILGMAQVLLADDLPPQEAREHVQTILHSGQLLLSLLNDILDFSKIEAGKLQLEAGLVEPEQVLRDTDQLFTAQAQAKGLTLKTTWNGPAQAHYQGDAHRLRQMLNNLLNNAIKFTAQGQVHVEGRVIHTTPSHSLLEFAVRDTGVGITPAQQALLFQPFSQTDPSVTRQFGGSGLGLSIVRSLAQAMGGEVGVDSTPGQGSRFWFQVPLAPWTSTQPQIAPPSNRTPVESAPTQPLRGTILIVEDNTINQMVLNKILKTVGLETEVAVNGQIAVERVMADADRFDLILMDIQMPVLDGYSATEQIRAWEQAQNRPRLPIVALTADAFPEDRARCLEAGMDEYMAKPVNKPELMRILREFLGN